MIIRVFMVEDEQLWKIFLMSKDIGKTSKCLSYKQTTVPNLILFMPEVILSKITKTNMKKIFKLTESEMIKLLFFPIAMKLMKLQIL